MSFAAYLVGFALWALTYGCAIGAAFQVVHSRLDRLGGAPRAAALALLSVTGVLAAYLLPGILGLLSRGSVAVASLLILAAASLDARRVRRAAGLEVEEPGTRAAAAGWEWAFAAAGVAIVAALVLAALLERAPTAIVNVDALNFHLPGVGAWIQTDSFWEVNQYVPRLAHGNYPQNGDLLLTSVILPWHNDAFARLVSFPLLAMAGLAVYAASIEVGAPRPAALLTAALFTATPAVVQPATQEVLTDTLLLATLATGVLFLLRFWRSGWRGDLWLAGIGLGIAFGSKWYGVSSVAVVVLAWVAGSLLARRPPRGVLRDGLVLVGLVLLAGGFWLLRNLVESANPLFPVKIAAFGVTLFDAPFDSVRAASGFSIAHYLGDPGVIADDILPALWRAASLPAVLLGLAVGAALLLAIRHRLRGRPLDPRIAMLAVVSLLLAAVYAITPYTALGREGDPRFAVYNVRYLMPALIAAAPVAASLAGRLERRRVLWYLTALAGLAVGAKRSFDMLGAAPVAQAVIVVALLAGATAAVVLLRPRLPRLSPPRLVAAALAATLLLLVAGQALQTRFNDSRYSDVDPALTWVFENAASGQRIGIVGFWGVSHVSPVWPLFGPRVGNRVEYVGSFRREMLRDYGSRRAFLAGLAEQGDDLLLVARDDPPRPIVRQDRWARWAGFPVVVRSPRFTLYRVPISSATGPPTSSRSAAGARL